MDITQTLVILFGSILYLIIMWDVLKTTLSLHGGGPVTNLVVEMLNKVINFSDRASSNERDHKHLKTPGFFYRYSHLLLTVTLFATWFFGLILSMTFILSAQADAVQQVSENNSGPLWLNRVYFVGASLTTAGFGDFVPVGVVWQAVTVLMAVSGLIVSSLGIGYVINMVNAVVSQRTLARQISELGPSPREVLLLHYHDGTFERFGQWCGTLSGLIIEHTARHLAYPMVHYVRADEDRESLPTAIANLDETLTVLFLEVPEKARPALPQLQMLRGAITAYLESLESQFFTDELPPEPAMPNGDWLIQYWKIHPSDPLQDLSQEEREALTKRRQILRAAVQSQGNQWAEIPSLLSSPSERRLDINTLARGASVVADSLEKRW